MWLLPLPIMDSMETSVLQDRDDVLTCLVTGNLQPIGWAKMEALGIKHLFSEPYFGGFGSDYCNPDNSDQSWKDRAELVKIAAQKAEKHFPGDWVLSVLADKCIAQMMLLACLGYLC